MWYQCVKNQGAAVSCKTKRKKSGPVCSFPVSPGVLKKTSPKRNAIDKDNEAKYVMNCMQVKASTSKFEISNARLYGVKP